MNIRKISNKIEKVKLVDTEKIFESDMRLMDDLENHFTIKNIFVNINNYWNREYTNNPVPEILFKGKFKFIK
jgi:hypothetical protein